MAMEKHFIQEGVIRSAIEKYLREEVNRAGYSGIQIQKTPLATRVTLFVEKPPIIIGKRGKRIKTLTEELQNKYGLENPVIDVQKIEVPTLDSNIVARRIAVALERGLQRRRVVFKAIRAVMGSGARGIEVVLSGKIVGKGGRTRVEKYSEGYMKKAGDSLKLVKIGSTQAYLKAGVIGVTVKIVLPNTKFPDQISVLTHAESEEKSLAEAEASPKKKKKKTVKKTAKKKEEKPVEDKKDKTQSEEKMIDAPAEKKQVNAPAEEKMIEAPAEEKQAETPAEEVKEVEAAQ
ncbi:MAG TPA: 30S ribosomal protein S3 [Candidatus Altiarchaeales archaeon]|nr:30S ribosomal protein S3 [Candidatus Altiarchaeales archaeon]